MTNEELLKYIQDESKGKYRTILELKKDQTQEGKIFRKQVRDLLKKDRRKSLEGANKLKYNKRFYKAPDLSDGKHRIVDSITGAVYSQDRLTKKAVKKTLLKPSGRQLRKEKRFLREKLKLNDDTKEVRELAE